MCCQILLHYYCNETGCLEKQNVAKGQYWITGPAEELANHTRSFPKQQGLQETNFLEWVTVTPVKRDRLWSFVNFVSILRV